MRKITLELEKRRKELGMTYKELAFEAGIMANTCRGVLQGWQEPNLLTVIAIASSLGLGIGLFDKIKGVKK